MFRSLSGRVRSTGSKEYNEVRNGFLVAVAAAFWSRFRSCYKKRSTWQDGTGLQHQERINVTCNHVRRGAVSLCKQNLILTVRFYKLVLQIIMDVVSTTEIV